MSIPTLFLADVHVGARYLGIPETETDPVMAFRHAVLFCKAKGIKRLIVAGDMFDNNKPLPYLVSKVQLVVAEAKSYGITCLGIAGDHDKVIGGSSWMFVCGFESDLEHRDVIMVDYRDNPEEVLLLLQRELESKADTVEFIVLHGQVPELFKFAEEKKCLPLRDLELCQYPALQGVVVGDLHNGPEFELVDPTCREQGVKVIYPASLVQLNCGEADKPGYLVWNGFAFTRENYAPPRLIVDRVITDEELNNSEFVEQVSSALEGIAADPTLELTPVIVLRYPAGCEQEVRNIRLPEKLITKLVKISPKREQEEQTPSIHLLRHELSGEQRMTEALRECCTDDRVYQLCWELIGADRHCSDPLLVLEQRKTLLQ